MGFDDWYFEGGIVEPVVPTEQVKVTVGSGSNGLSTIVSNGLRYTCVGGGGASPSIPEGTKPSPKYAIDPWGGAPNFDGGFDAASGYDRTVHQQVAVQNGHVIPLAQYEAERMRQINEGHRRAEIMRRERDAHAQKMAAMVLAGNSVIYDPCAGTITAAPASKAFTEDEILAIKNAAFDAGVAASRPAAKLKEPLPIHRAMNRMLHADERYENKAFMPGGLLARAGDMA